MTWLGKAWSWLKENWWVLLSFPLALGAFWIGRLFRSESAKPTLPPLVPDPEAEANKRKAEEEEKRRKELEKSNIELENRIKELIAAKDRDLEAFREDMKKHYEQLRNDPEAVNEWLIQIGKGT